jgi:hypothetical protein
MQVLWRRDVYRALSSVSGFVGNAAAQLQQAAGEDVAELAEVRPGGIRTSSRAYCPQIVSHGFTAWQQHPKSHPPNHTKNDNGQSVSRYAQPRAGEAIAPSCGTW